MGTDWLTDGLVTQQSTTLHSAILHENVNQRTGLWKVISRSLSQGILTNLMQFETGAQRRQRNCCGVHKMLSLSTSISLPHNSHFLQVTLPYIRTHTTSRHLESSPCSATQKHSTFRCAHLGSAREHKHAGFSFLGHSDLHGSFHFLASFHKYFSPPTTPLLVQITQVFSCMLRGSFFFFHSQSDRKMLWGHDKQGSEASCRQRKLKKSAVSRTEVNCCPILRHLCHRSCKQGEVQILRCTGYRPTVVTVPRKCRAHNTVQLPMLAKHGNRLQVSAAPPPLLSTRQLASTPVRTAGLTAFVLTTVTLR